MYYSQFYEDRDYLVPLFADIGIENAYCFEVGAMDGKRFSNTRCFLDKGWRGLFIESNDEWYHQCCANAIQYGDKVTCIECEVNTEDNNIDRLLDFANFPVDLDLGSIDIDGQDYHVWKAMEKYRPRVMVVEFSPSVAPDYIPPLNEPGQAGLGAILELSREKGYRAIVANKVNLICVRDDINTNDTWSYEYIR
jgi:hypothetical protein